MTHKQTETESDFPQEDYEHRQAAMDAAYSQEYRRWFATLSETDRQRLTLDGLHEPDCNLRALSGGTGGEIALELVAGKSGYDDDKRRVPTLDADIPVGTDHDQLRDIGLSAKQAESVLRWISCRNSDEVNRLAADRLARFFALLMPPTTMHKINLHLLGIRSLAGLFLTNRDGSTKLTDLAQRAGMSKQLLAFHARKIADAMNFHGIAQKRESARANYSAAARARWGALTPEQRRARRHGQKGIVGTQQATSNDQNLTISTSL